jgi:plastocyanin
MTRDRRILLAAACLFALTAAGLPAAAGPAVHVIRITQMAFDRAPANLRVGDTIEWVNGDIFEHTATAKNGSFDVDLKPGASGRIVLKTAGEIAFYCRYHPGMTGVLAVAK